MTAALALALLRGTVDAQTFDLGDVSNGDSPVYDPGTPNWPWESSARRNMVRYGNNLYAVVVRDSGTIEIRHKPDDASSPWATLVPLVNPHVAGQSTGIAPFQTTASTPANTVAMAVTSSGCLHITWGRYRSIGGAEANFMHQYYRCYRIDPGVFTHDPQDMTVYASGQGIAATDAMAIAVGPNDEVYMAVLRSNAARVYRLYRGGANWLNGSPTGPSPTWTNLGLIPATDSQVFDNYTSPHLNMVVDSLGMVQMSFRRFLHATWPLEHYSTRVYDPNGGWSPVDESIAEASMCFNGYLASTADGVTHLLYMEYFQGPEVYELRYRRRTGTNAWSTPTTVETFPGADVGNNHPSHSFALAAFADGSRVLAIYRDYASHQLAMKQKLDTAAEFEFISALTEPTVPSTLLDDTDVPNVRNTLFPADNRMSEYLDVSFHRPNSLQYPYTHKRLHISQIVVNSPPIANAGADQAIHPNETVYLDGTASFDDNTVSAALDYAWSFSSFPNGSCATLTNADTAMPSFVADVAGRYVVELTVTDGSNLSSTDEVEVDTNNLAPTAVAEVVGGGLLVIVTTAVNLDGSNSVDPESDTLTYSWTITSAPAGSTSQIVGATDAVAAFTPDVEGIYILTLTAGDFIGPGAPDSVVITATSAQSYARLAIFAASTLVSGLAANQVTTNGNKTAFLNFLSQAAAAIQQNDVPGAIDKLQKCIERTNGCEVNAGVPEGDGPGRDWITDCLAQAAILVCLRDALVALNP